MGEIAVRGDLGPSKMIEGISEAQAIGVPKNGSGFRFLRHPEKIREKLKGNN